MKKKYVKPISENLQTEFEMEILAGTINEYTHADAKENSFEEEDATNPIKDVEFHNIWEDAEDED